MSQENVEIVRRIFDGWATGDLSAEADAFDRHVVFVVSRDFPAWGVQHGLDEVRTYMRDFLAQWEHATFDAERVRAVGDTVIADVVQRARGKASGAEGELRFFMLFTFRGRRIVRCETVMHEQEALDAVGLST
jgi:ketosteroid isomerase-like protein